MGVSRVMAATPKSDLAIRTVSAAVLLGIAGTALYMGGTVFLFFVALVAFTVAIEWRNIVVRFPDSDVAKGIWMAIGGLYAAFGCAAVLLLHEGKLFIPVLGAVIGTDVGAYFAGRFIGGPKIAPAISPSKTWAGLFGGMAGATLMLLLVAWFDWKGTFVLPALVGLSFWAGPPIAIVAQAGDFFESWMKRRAGVKDSGNLLPGHGGMFDRVDGLLAASIAVFSVLVVIGKFG